MKNAPVVVIRNRDNSTANLGKYRIRNLITGKISYSNSVALRNPTYIGNVDDYSNLKSEQIQRCDWALTGSLATINQMPKKIKKTRIDPGHYGITFDNGHYYFEETHGSMAAVYLGENADNRFVWLSSK